MHHHANSLTNASTINVSFSTSKYPTCDRYQSTIFLFLAYQYLDNGEYIHSSLNISTDPCVSTCDQYPLRIIESVLIPFCFCHPKKNVSDFETFWPEPLVSWKFLGRYFYRQNLNRLQSYLGASIQVMVHGHVDILRLWVAN